MNYNLLWIILCSRGKTSSKKYSRFSLAKHPKSKRKVYLTSFLSIAGALILMISMYISKDVYALSRGLANSGNTANIGDDLPMSRALVAKMLAMTFGDMNCIDNMDRYIEFSDSSPELWYDKYINYAYVSGLMLGSGGMFMPEQPVTLEQAQILLDKLDKNNGIKLQITDQNKDLAVSYALWTELYTKLLRNLEGGLEYYGITERNIIILATPGNNNKLSGYNMITDSGPMTFTGLRVDAYVDKQIRILEKNGDLLAVLRIENLEPTVKNAYIAANDTENITIFVGGAERTYGYSGLDGDCSGKICDITISAPMAKDIIIIEDKFSDTLMSSTEKELEFKNKGMIGIGDNFKVYSKASGPVYWKRLSDLLVGEDMAEYIIRDGKVCAAVITRRPPFEKLRIAIGDTGFRSLYHAGVTMSGNKPVTVKYGSQSKVYNAGETIIVNSDLFKEGKRIYIQQEPGGLIELSSIQRNWPDAEKPKYSGNFEVSKEAEGYVIVNIVDAEEYLYTVVPSEMPTGHGVEALKVQAVTARSYAYNQFYENRFHKYGANMDDSVSCQVYNNIPSNELSIAAVDATRGMLLSYKGNVISTNFFSTSSGMTANSGEVWANGATMQFPTATPEYLRSVRQYNSEGYYNLRNEDAAAAFFKSMDIVGYDSKFNWFRWTTELTAKELTASINQNLKSRYEANPLLIKTLFEGKYFRSAPISSIGEFIDAEVMNRGEGGNILTMKITGTEATILVMTEYNIRALIRPYQFMASGGKIALTLMDGSVIENYSLMPSAFYVMEKSRDESGNVSGIKFYGGGMGHGAGMSQNGVRGMIDQGFAFKEILLHYFPGTEIKVN